MGTSEVTFATDIATCACLDSVHERGRNAALKDPDVVPFFGGCGLLLILFRVYYDRTERGRGLAMRMYAQKAYPFFLRMTPAVGPLVGIGLLLLASLMLLPRWLAAWGSVPVVVLLLATFLLGYRYPPPLMPRWLQEEIDKGELEPAVPDRMDWAQFWLILTFGILGSIALVLLIVVYGGGTS